MSFTSITDARAKEFTSVDLSQSIDLDPAYAQKKKRKKRPLQGLKSLKQAFILKEILTPYEEIR